MNLLICVLINWPVVAVNIVANTFYVFCLVCPTHGERIKQPLKLLLWTLICSTVTYLMSLIVIFFSGLQPEIIITHISSGVSISTLYTSMTSSVWLNFFYYTQIVPAQRALFIWIKKNIKPIIYGIWLFERFCTLIDFTSIVLNAIYSDEFEISNNSTMDHDIHVLARAFSKWWADTFIIAVSVQKAHFIFCMVVMVMSSGCTVVYLCRHMRRMAAHGQPLSCPGFRGQVRVTVTGVLQGVLYVSCAVCSLWNFFFRQTFINLYIHITVINLYMSGTTFNLGAGQAVFRQRAADIWHRAARCCKAPQVQQSEQGG